MTTTRDTASPLLRELERVHDMLRRDLRTCRDLADAAMTGVPAVHLRDTLGQLASRGPLFQLKVNCLRYCELVHAHHGGEDESLFPAVRASAPHLGAVVDRLEADHRLVSDLLDQVEFAAAQLDDVEAITSRKRLADALTALSRHLLEHLDVEEEALAPVLRAWQGWPPE
jgi:iron-sulfur cluster repair protein YtfE (RIC family)